MEIELKKLVVENRWLRRDLGINYGWGKGYVLIPIGHFLHGVDYNDIDVDVHGGLTYGEEVSERHVFEYNLEKEDIGKWMVGFDTVHVGDTLQNWPQEAVIQETERLESNLKKMADKL